MYSTLSMRRWRIELIIFVLAAGAVSGLIYWLGWHAPLDGLCASFQAMSYQGSGGTFVPPAEWPAAWRWRITWLLLWRTLALAMVAVGLLRRWSRPALLLWCCVPLFLVWFGRDSAITPKDVICMISSDPN